MDIAAAHIRVNKYNAWIVLLAFIVILAGPLPALSNDSLGLKLSLYTEGGETRYTMGSPIKIYLKIENISRWPINAPRDFSQVELHRSLVITDPSGKDHVLSMEEIATDMPPPLFWNDKETSPAEVLPEGWSRTVTIADLGSVFSMITKRAGVYTISASQPFVMFPWTIDGDDGLRGIVDPEDPKYWRGNIKSANILKIIVTPNEGARFKLRTIDASLNKPVKQVPIKVYEAATVPDNLTNEEIWKTISPLMTGTTDMQGWAAWNWGIPCMPRGNYIAVGYYQNEYKSVLFEYDSEDEWKNACGGLIDKRIFFKDLKHEYSVFGLNSVWIRNNARIESGDVAVQGDSHPGPWLVDEYEIALGGGVWVMDGIEIKGDSVYLDSTASVWDLYYSSINAGGLDQVRGETYPFAVLVWPDVETLFVDNFTVGTEEVVVPSQGKQTIGPDIAYGNITVGSHATLNLLTGNYQVNNVSLGSHAKIFCLGPVNIWINGALTSGSAKAAYIGPQAGEGFSAKDVIIYVNGDSEAVLFGQGTNIHANIFSKNGNVVTGEGCELTGSFIGQNITIGQKSVVNWDGAFSSGGGTPEPPLPPQITLTATSYKEVARTKVDLVWGGAEGSIVKIIKSIMGEEPPLSETVANIPGEINTYTDDDLGKKPKGEYEYIVCELDGLKCSEPVVFNF